jgi:hypothetical protein
MSRVTALLVLDATPALSHNTPSLMNQTRGVGTWLAFRSKKAGFKKAG